MNQDNLGLYAPVIAFVFLFIAGLPNEGPIDFHYSPELQHVIAPRTGTLEDGLVLNQAVNLTRTTANDRAPRWSPDGKQILFESDRDGNWNIFLMQRDGSQVTRLTDHPDDDRYPAWSPDGSRIVFQSNRDGSDDLHVLALSDHKIRRLTNTPEAEQFPDWSPDGGRIAFTTAKDSSLQIFVLHLAEATVMQLTASAFQSAWPRWSPNGAKILFFSRRDTKGRDDELYLMEADGSNHERLTYHQGHDFCPAWARHGNWIAAATIDEEHGRGIAIYDLSGSLQNHIGRGFIRVTTPDWSPDGSSIAYAASAGDDYDIFLEEVHP